MEARQRNLRALLSILPPVNRSDPCEDKNIFGSVLESGGKGFEKRIEVVEYIFCVCVDGGKEK